MGKICFYWSKLSPFMVTPFKLVLMFAKANRKLRKLSPFEKMVENSGVPNALTLFYQLFRLPSNLWVHWCSWHLVAYISLHVSDEVAII